MRGGILDCRCARRSARRQVGTKGWSYSDRTKGWALELNSTALAYHVQFAELDAHNLRAGVTTASLGLAAVLSAALLGRAQATTYSFTTVDFPGSSFTNASGSNE